MTDRNDRNERARKIDELRQEMAKLDAQLLATLDKRARAARRVGELRREAPGLTAAVPFDGSATGKLVAQGAGDLPPEALREIFREIHAACLALELPEPVSYVGAEGDAGHAAARARFGASADLLAAETAGDALENVQRQKSAFAVVPLETRSDGPVQATIDALIRSDLKVVAAFEAPVNLELLRKTPSLEGLTKLFITAKDHARCTKLIERLGVPVVDVKTPLAACQHAAEDAGAGAVAMGDLAGQFELQIAEKNVLDHGDERVRFAVVAPRPSPKSGEDVTLIAFSVADNPGALFDVLRQFAERQINMTKIQSRPAGEGWMYMFFAEIVGHPTDRNLVTALEEVKRLTKFFKVLGSCPATA